jgi:Flp pilus assembly protein TadD
MGRTVWVVLGLLLAGCGATGVTATSDKVLPPPSTAKAEAARAMQEGNRLFAAREWEAAMGQYEAAVKIQPTLPEAHYNLGMALYVLRQDAKARKHFVEAANLAPGDKVIWNAPMFKEYGRVESTSKSGPLVMPAVGAH